MLRSLSIALLVPVLCVAACYDPERREAPSTTPVTEPTPADDECDTDCQLCLDYCNVQLDCAAEPPTFQDCAWNCVSWLELATPECSAEYREVAECIGALDCPGYDDPTTCVPEIQAYHAECDDEAEAEGDAVLPLMAR